jgi:hypothetical protein
MSQRETSKGEQIRDEIRETPCIETSEISEKYGVSPATVTRVVRNLDEDLRQMRSLRMKKHVDDLYDIEYDILWIVAQQPDATQAEVKAAYEKHADIMGLRSGHPETGDGAPKTAGDLWRDCLDSSWQGRLALSGDLQHILDEDRVSGAAEQAVEALDNDEIKTEDKRREGEAKKGTRLHLMHEIADAVGDEERAQLHLQKKKPCLGEETTHAIADELGVTETEDKTMRDLKPQIAKELSQEPDEVATGTNGKLQKGDIKNIHAAIVDDEPDHECRYCGDTFKNAAGCGKHEKHCDENPGSEPIEGTPSRDGELTDTQRETVEAIVEHETSEISDLVEVLDVGYGATNSRLNYIRKEGYDLYSESLLKDAREILDDIDSETIEDETDDEAADAAEDVDQDDQEESDEVEMQDVPTDRDIEQADEAVEEIVDEDTDEETLHVKNEEPETFATEMRPAEAFEIIRDLDDAMLARGIYREVLDAARKGEI